MAAIAITSFIPLLTKLAIALIIAIVVIALVAIVMKKFKASESSSYISQYISPVPSGQRRYFNYGMF